MTVKYSALGTIIKIVKWWYDIRKAHQAGGQEVSILSVRPASFIPCRTHFCSSKSRQPVSSRPWHTQHRGSPALGWTNAGVPRTAGGREDLRWWTSKERQGGKRVCVPHRARQNGQAATISWSIYTQERISQEGVCSLPNKNIKNSFMLFTMLQSYSKGFMSINSLQCILLTILWGRYYYPHSSDENTDVRGASSCPESPSRYVLGHRVEPGGWLQATLLPPHCAASSDDKKRRGQLEGINISLDILVWHC